MGSWILRLLFFKQESGGHVSIHFLTPSPSMGEGWGGGEEMESQP